MSYLTGGDNGGGGGIGGFTIMDGVGVAGAYLALMHKPGKGAKKIPLIGSTKNLGFMMIGMWVGKSGVLGQVSGGRL